MLMEANDLNKSEEQELNQNSTPENTNIEENEQNDSTVNQEPVEENSNIVSEKSEVEQTGETAKQEEPTDEAKPQLDKVDLSVLSKEKLCDRLKYVCRHFDIT